MGDLEIWKAIWEIRFPAAARLFDNRGYLASKWQGKFGMTEWTIARNQLIVHDKPNSKHVRVDLRALGVVVERPESYQHFCSLASEFSVETLRRLTVKTISRVGLRLIQIAEREDFPTLVTKMRQQLYNVKDEDWEKVGGIPVDVGLPLTFEFGDRQANFNIGPMEQEQLSGFFKSKEVKDDLPLVGLYLDFDLYSVNPEIDPRGGKNPLSSFMKSGGQLIQDVSARFVEHFGGFR